MRAEVINRSRSIKIQGENNSHAGQVLISDFTDIVNNIPVERAGKAILNYVEFYYMSQKDLHHAALRFEDARGGGSIVNGCSFTENHQYAFYISEA
jgi:hypothetical protein